MPAFIPGLELCRRFYEEVVRSLLEQHFPELPYAAARIGSGSDILGFDTEMSMDHEWGPRLQIFLRDQDIAQMPLIDEMLRDYLPHNFAGFPIDVTSTNEPGKDITTMREVSEGPINHRIFVLTLHDFLHSYLAYDLDQPLTVADWLTFPGQKLRAITAGAVYHDGIGEITAQRERLAWYPHDIWLYMLAASWARTGQEEHLMPRAGFVGDEIGSSLIGSRLVRDIMLLCFLMEKQYAPYPKWFGTAFKQLQASRDLLPLLRQAQIAAIWQEREEALVGAYEFLARKHNESGLTRTLPETATSFFGRPFKVIHAETFAQALIEQITDPEVDRLAQKHLIGGIDHFSDSTDLHCDDTRRAALKRLYE